jgi:hypothetical protein
MYYYYYLNKEMGMNEKRGVFARRFEGYWS